MKLVYHIHSEEMFRTSLQRHNYPKKTVSAIKRDGALIINRQPVAIRYILKEDGHLIAKLPEEAPSTYPRPSNKHIKILYEDTCLIVVSKPVHLDCAPSRERPHDSLIERVMCYLNHSTGKVQYIVPHIVTGLDRNTTGIVIFTKHGHIHHLMSAFGIGKWYICVCYGRTKERSVIEAPVGRNRDSVITQCTTPSGKYAKAGYKTLSSHHSASLCEVELHTGRTHQIRVHSKHIGHPLIGDNLYDSFHPRTQTQSLQCYKVKFMHPIYNKEIKIISDYKSLEKIYRSVN